MSYEDYGYWLQEGPVEMDLLEQLQNALRGNDVQAAGNVLNEMVENSSSESARIAMERLRKKILDLLAQVEKLQAVPAEPQDWSDTSVIRFEKTFGRSNQRFTYAAIRPLGMGGFWYVTSTNERTRRFSSWITLWEFIERSEPKRPTVWVANSWAAL